MVCRVVPPPLLPHTFIHTVLLASQWRNLSLHLVPTYIARLTILFLVRTNYELENFFDRIHIVLKPGNDETPIDPDSKLLSLQFV